MPLSAAILAEAPEHSSRRPAPPFRPESAAYAWGAWIVLAGVLAARVGFFPAEDSVALCYRGACDAWWHGREMYVDLLLGFIYMPQAALLYTPFYVLPQPIGEPLYRVAIVALLAWSVWRLTRLTSGRPWNEHFFTVSIVALGMAAGAAYNGQYNVPLAATLILATCALIERRWWPAALWLALSIMLKPIAVAPVLLAIALYPALWWRTPILAAVCFAAPFLCSIRDPAYAWGEYRTFWDTVVRATLPHDRRFAEFSTVLYWFGLDLDNAKCTVCRAVAAVVTLALGFVALRRHGQFRGGILLWGLGVSYLMIFNPRTEGVTYSIVAPAFGLFGALELTADRAPAWRRAVGWALVASGILMIFVHELMPRSGRYFEIAQGRKDLLVRPVLTMAFYLWLVWLTLVEISRPKLDSTRSTPLPCPFQPA